MARYMFSREGSWNYPTLGIGNVVTGDVIESPTAPDAYWSLVAAGTAITKPITTSPVTYAGIADGSFYAFSTAANAFVVTAGNRTSESDLGVFGGLPVVADRGYGPGRYQTAGSTNVNARIKHVLACDVNDIRLVFTNWNGAVNSEGAAPNALVITAGVEITGTTYPVMFRGATTLTLDIDGIAVSDPIACDGLTGDTVWSRVHAVGTTIRAVRFTDGTGGEGTNASATDQSITGTISGSGNCYSPAAILGIPARGVAQRWAAVVGDSIPSGQGDDPNNSYLKRAMSTASLPFLDISRQSETLVAGMGTLSASKRRRVLASAAPIAFIGSYADNDISSGTSLAATQALFLATAFVFANRNARTARNGAVLTHTLIPRTTSSDSFQTTGNQTVVTGEAVRLLFNAWIRDGAPIDATTKVAVATGTSSNVRRAGASSHPLAAPTVSGTPELSLGFIEMADIVESARDSGKWKVLNLNGTATTTSGTKNLTLVSNLSILNGDGIIGTGIPANSYVVSGGGTATLVIDQNATASASVSIFATHTTDGTHPSSRMHQLMAAAIPMAGIIAAIG